MHNHLSSAPKPVWWRDAKIRGYIYQVVLVALIIAVFAYLFNNLTDNLERQKIQTGFGFLWDQEAGFDINYTPFIDFQPTDTHSKVLLVGIVNSLLVALTGIVFATIIGFVIGIARLSKNWLLAKISHWYIEIFRNVPLLVQIFFWYNAIILGLLPSPRQSLSWGDAFYLNARGLSFPELVAESGFGYVVIAFLVAIAINFYIKHWAKKRQDLTGQIFPVARVTTLILFLLPLSVFFILNQPMHLAYPIQKRFGLEGGINIIPEFIALFIALATYTAAFIAESVRSGIQAVSKGQIEAYSALGVKSSVGMRLIVIPQAMRVIIPQLTNQYLNLTKNSSLATAIGYPEIASVFMGTSMSITQRTVEIMVITMGVYMLFSLFTSLFMNWYNSRMALVER